MMDDWTGLPGTGPEARRVRGRLSSQSLLHLQWELNVWIIEVQPQFFFLFFLPTAAPVNVTRLHREAKWPEGHPKWHKTTAEWYKMKTKTCKITKRTQKNNHKGTKWHNTSRKRCKTTTIWLQRQTQLMQNYKVWGQREIQNDTIQPQKDASQPHGDITMRG